MSQKTSKPGSGSFDFSLRLVFPSEEEAGLARASVLPELNAGHAKRSRTSIGIKNRILSINIKADDPTSMRAALNGCLNPIMLAESLWRLDGNGNRPGKGRRV